MTACGYTPDAIDVMPMHDALALVAYWRDHPPAHEVLAAAYGLAPRPRADPDDPSNIGALIARAPDGTLTR